MSVPYVLGVEEEGREEGREEGLGTTKGRRKLVWFGGINKGEGIAREIPKIRREGKTRQEIDTQIVCVAGRRREGGREGGREEGRMKEIREALLSV